MGGGALYAPHPVVFCPLLKKSSGNPYLKILDFSQLFIADAPMKKNPKKFSFIPAQSTFRTPSTKIFSFFCFNKKIFLQTQVEIIFRDL